MLKCLDLFCGAGGATKGLQEAGFYVTGVDLSPQPNYCGDEFIQCDALTVPLTGYDVIWASPPCQGYSRASACRPGLAATYPKLIEPIRERLIHAGVPYVIENVGGAKYFLRSPMMLCGAMFGKETYRHRFFESNVNLIAPAHPKHVTPASKAGHWKPGTYMSVSGHCSPIALARKVMGIDWMTRNELAESIPPDFSRHIGYQVVAAIQQKGQEAA